MGIRRSVRRDRLYCIYSFCIFFAKSEDPSQDTLHCILYKVRLRQPREPIVAESNYYHFNIIREISEITVWKTLLEQPAKDRFIKHEV